MKLFWIKTANDFEFMYLFKISVILISSFFQNINKRQKEFKTSDYLIT